MAPRIKVSLPTQKSTPVNDMSGLVALVYGPPKIGKSTLCSTADDVFFLATERGLDHLSTYKVQIDDWETFVAYVDELLSNTQNPPFKTVAIDTIDNAYEFCATHVCRRLGIDHQSDAGYGKGHSMVNSEFNRHLTRLAQGPWGLWMVSHAKEVEVKPVGGGEKHQKKLPTLTPAARKLVLAMADIIMYADFETLNENGNIVQRRVLRTRASKEWEAGDRTDLLPPTIPLDYKALSTALHGGTIIRDLKEIKKATGIKDADQWWAFVRKILSDNHCPINDEPIHETYARWSQGDIAAIRHAVQNGEKKTSTTRTKKKQTNDSVATKKDIERAKAVAKDAKVYYDAVTWWEFIKNTLGPDKCLGEDNDEAAAYAKWTKADAQRVCDEANRIGEGN